MPNGKMLYRTTILVDRDLWKRFKIKAINKGVSASRLLEQIIEKEVDD